MAAPSPQKTVARSVAAPVAAQPVATTAAAATPMSVGAQFRSPKADSYRISAAAPAPAPASIISSVPSPSSTTAASCGGNNAGSITGGLANAGSFTGHSLAGSFGTPVGMAGVMDQAAAIQELRAECLQQQRAIELQATSFGQLMVEVEELRHAVANQPPQGNRNLAASEEEMAWLAQVLAEERQLWQVELETSRAEMEAKIAYTIENTAQLEDKLCKTYDSFDQQVMVLSDLVRTHQVALDGVGNRFQDVVRQVELSIEEQIEVVEANSAQVQNELRKEVDGRLSEMQSMKEMLDETLRGSRAASDPLENLSLHATAEVTMPSSAPGGGDFEQLIDALNSMRQELQDEKRERQAAVVILEARDESVSAAMEAVRLDCTLQINSLLRTGKAEVTSSSDLPQNSALPGRADAGEMEDHAGGVVHSQVHNDQMQQILASVSACMTKADMALAMEGRLQASNDAVAARCAQLQSSIEARLAEAIGQESSSRAIILGQLSQKVEEVKVNTDDLEARLQGLDLSSKLDQKLEELSASLEEERHARRIVATHGESLQADMALLKEDHEKVSVVEAKVMQIIAELTEEKSTREAAVARLLEELLSSQAAVRSASELMQDAVIDVSKDLEGKMSATMEELERKLETQSGRNRSDDEALLAAAAAKATALASEEREARAAELAAVSQELAELKASSERCTVEVREIGTAVASAAPAEPQGLSEEASEKLAALRASLEEEAQARKALAEEFAQKSSAQSDDRKSEALQEMQQRITTVAEELKALKDDFTWKMLESSATAAASRESLSKVTEMSASLEEQQEKLSAMETTAAQMSEIQTVVESLQASLSETQQASGKSQAAVTQLQCVVESKMEEVAQRMDVLNSQLTAWASSVDGVRQRSDKLEAKLNDLALARADQGPTHEKLEAVEQASKVRSEEVQRTVEALQASLSEIAEDRGKTQATVTRLECALESKMEDVSHRISELSSKMAVSASSVDGLQQRSDNLEAKLSDLALARTAQGPTQEQLEAVEEASRVRSEEVQRTMERVQVSLSQIDEDRGKTQATVSRLECAVESKMEEVSQRISELSNKVADSAGSVDGLQQRSDNLEAKLSELASQPSPSRESLEAVAESKAKTEEVQRTVEGLQASLSELDKDRSKTQATVTRLECAVESKMEELCTRMSDLTTKVTSCSSDVEGMLKKSASFEAKLVDLAATSPELLPELLQQQQQLQAMVTELQQECVTSQANATRTQCALESKVEDVSTRMDNVSETLARCASSVQELAQQSDGLQAKFAEMPATTSQVDELWDEVSKIEARMQAAVARERDAREASRVNPAVASNVAAPAWAAEIQADLAQEKVARKDEIAEVVSQTSAALAEVNAAFVKHLQALDAKSSRLESLEESLSKERSERLLQMTSMRQEMTRSLEDERTSAEELQQLIRGAAQAEDVKNLKELLSEVLSSGTREDVQHLRESTAALKSQLDDIRETMSVANEGNVDEVASEFPKPNPSKPARLFDVRLGNLPFTCMGTSEDRKSSPELVRVYREGEETLREAPPRPFAARNTVQDWERKPAWSEEVARGAFEV